MSLDERIEGIKQEAAYLVEKGCAEDPYYPPSEMLMVLGWCAAPLAVAEDAREAVDWVPCVLDGDDLDPGVEGCLHCRLRSRLDALEVTE